MKHLDQNNETYINHLIFSSKIGLTLIFRGLIFLFHAIFPICEIPKKWNLENTSIKLYKWNEYANKRKNK